MSDWEDFVEGYGYTAGDPDAMDKIMGDWQDDDEDNEALNNLYGTVTTNKLLSKNMRLGFNNFKPFGSVIQRFHKKPITLIYGPNSIGKSSVIHAMFYLNYVFNQKKTELRSTDIFGDNLNLGGFEKFVHKRDIENSLTLEMEIENCSEAILSFIDEPYNVELSLEDFEKAKKIIISDHFPEFASDDSISYNEIEKVAKMLKNERSYHVDTDSYLMLFNNMYNFDLITLAKKLVKINGTFSFNFFAYIVDDLKPLYELAKSMYIIKNINPLIDQKKGLAVDDNIYNEIVSMAEMYFTRLERINIIKHTMIPLKIQVSIKHSVELGKQYFESIKYYIDDILYFEVNENIVNGKIQRKGNESLDVTSNHLPLILGYFANDICEWGNSLTRIEKKEFKIIAKNHSALSWLASKRYKGLVGYLNELLYLNQMHYIGPLRFYPARSDAFNESDIDESVMPNSQDAWTLLKSDKNLGEKINKWLLHDSKLKTPYEIKYRKLYSEDRSYSIDEMVFEDKRSGTQVSNRDLGLGISQVLPILISTNRNKNTMIAIEQPELHLHPAVQSELADEFIRSYHENKNDFMIETHSGMTPKY